MDWILNAITYIQRLGPTVMLPIFIFIIAVIFGAKPGKAFRAALTVGVAFVGINLVVGLLVDQLGGAAQAMVQRTGTQLDVVDVGWAVAATIAFGGKVGLWVIPIAIAVNILMLAIKATKTLNIDIWNFWHFAFSGSLVYVATQNLLLSLAVAALNSAIVLFLADWTAPGVQKLYKVPGISIPHGFSAAYVPIAIPLNWLIDKIPGLNKLDADPETIRKRFGLIGEPLIMGVVIGLVIGALAWLGDSAVGDLGVQIQMILTLSVDLGAVMLLMPRMVSILMEGLITVSEVAADFMKKRSGSGEFYIGLDSAILIGHPSAIALGLLLSPITIALAIWLSSLGLNRVLPFTDLAVLPFMVAMISPVTRGNIVRGLIIGTIVIGVGLIIATNMCVLHTGAAVDAQIVFPEGASQISSICDGTNPLTWLLVKVVGGAGWLGFILATAVLAVMILLYKMNSAAWEAVAGGDAPAE